MENFTDKLIIAVIVACIVTLCVSVENNEIAYSYKYDIDEPKIGLVIHRWEKRYGDNVHGGYSFLESNGKVRVVDYSVEGQKGFKAYVTFRRPPGGFKGHLKFPKEYRTPIQLAKPVGLITPDLFIAKDKYPDLSKFRY